MRFAIVHSKPNIASTNIVKTLKKDNFLPQVPILDTKKDVIYADEFTIKKYPFLKITDILIYASTHKSKKGEPSLCLHAPGNWRSADLGGSSGKVCPTSAFILKYLFQQLNKNAEQAKQENKLDPAYNITMEVTHHGPLIEVPCCFIEIGSSEKQWQDKQASEVIAKTIMSLQNYKKSDYENWIPCIGIGGPHYAPNFNKIQLNSNYAISHIIPEYSLPLTIPMLQQAEQKTTEQIKLALVDWKGCGNSEQRQQTINLLDKFGFKYKRTSNIEK